MYIYTDSIYTNIYLIYFHKINNSSRTNSNILIIVGNFQQNNFGNFQQWIFVQIPTHFFGQIIIYPFLGVQLFVMFLFHFFLEYFKNILQIRPHP